MDKKVNPAKEFLGRYTALNKSIDSLTRSIDAAMDRATKCTYTLNPIKVQGGGGAYDRMAEDIATKLDCVNLLMAAREEAMKALQQILDAIDSLPNETQRLLLRLRYVEGLKWEDVEHRINYEHSRTNELHGLALVKINRWLKLRTKTE